MAIVDKLKTAKLMKSKHGWRELSRQVIDYSLEATVERVLPEQEVTVEINQVSVPFECGTLYYYLHKFVPGLDISEFIAPGRIYNKKHIVDAIREHVSRGDRGVVIGGGVGVSTVWMSKTVGDNGSVNVYEAALGKTETIEATLQRNDTSGDISVHHALVGPELNVMGDKDDPELVDPAELPECDVLEMDCEGAEISILEEMEIRPRVVIVETHPGWDSPASEVEDRLTEASYDIVDRSNTVPGQGGELLIARA